MGEELARPAVAALHLVEDECGAVLPAQAAERLQETVLRHVDAAAALDTLDDHRGHAAFRQFVRHGIAVVQVAERDVVVRVEGGDDRRIVRQRHGARSAPVEAAAEGDDAVPAGLEGRQFGGVLVGFRAAVVQEEGVILVTADLADAACQLLLQGIADAVGVEADLVELRLQRLDVMRVGVPHGNDGVAAVQVEVFLSLVIPDGAALRPHRGDVEEGIYVEQIHILEC